MVRQILFRFIVKLCFISTWVCNGLLWLSRNLRLCVYRLDLRSKIILITFRRCRSAQHGTCNWGRGYKVLQGRACSSIHPRIWTTSGVAMFSRVDRYLHLKDRLIECLIGIRAEKTRHSWELGSNTPDFQLSSTSEQLTRFEF